MTLKEKADRYDVMQTTLAVALENYHIKIINATKRCVEKSYIGAYNKGLADAYTQAAEDIERWIVKEGEAE